MLSRFSSVLCGVLLSVLPALAQTQASISGVIHDPSGAVIPGVTITVTNPATNFVRSAISNEAGVYNFPALQPGRYALTAKQPGFKETTQEFELAVSQRAELNLAMEVGASTQSVTVAANAVLLETASSDVSNLRTRQQVVDLPLNNRNFTNLVQLAPGVNNHGNSTNVTNGGYTAGRGTSGAVVNGNPSDIGIYLFDGILGVDADANVLILYPPVDSIQEFKVQTSSAPAAYGGGPSIINVTFRSGTNNLHGTLYLESGVKTTISACERFELVDFAEYVVDQVL